MTYYQLNTFFWKNFNDSRISNAKMQSENRTWKSNMIQWNGKQRNDSNWMSKAVAILKTIKFELYIVCLCHSLHHTRKFIKMPLELKKIFGLTLRKKNRSQNKSSTRKSWDRHTKLWLDFVLHKNSNIKQRSIWFDYNNRIFSVLFERYILIGQLSIKYVFSLHLSIFHFIILRVRANEVLSQCCTS